MTQRSNRNIIIQRDEMTIPGTTISVKSIKRINMNRDVLSFDCSFDPVQTVLTQVKEYCDGLMTYDPNLKYNLVLPTHSEGSIQSIERSDDGWNFDKAKVVYSLSSTQLSQIKGMVARGMEAVLNVFTSFYNEARLRRNSVGTEMLNNEEYGQFMRALGDSVGI